MAVPDLNRRNSWVEQILAGIGQEPIETVPIYVYAMPVSKHLTLRTGKPGNNNFAARFPAF
jgi:hypothetical protein